MKTRSYGTVRVSVLEDGATVLHLPKTLVRDLGLKSGDHVSIRRQKGPAWRLRFFRKAKSRWLQLLPGRASQALPRRPVFQFRLELMRARPRRSSTPRRCP